MTESDDKPLPTVGAFEAKTHLSALLERVEKGETIIITRHGRPVAKLVPAAAGKASAEQLTLRQQAIERIRQLSKGQNLAGLTVRQLIDEGRE